MPLPRSFGITLFAIISALGLILLSPNMFVRYGLAKTSAPFGFNEPALISIPLSFLTLVVVSLIWRQKAAQAASAGGSAQ